MDTVEVMSQMAVRPTVPADITESHIPNQVAVGGVDRQALTSSVDDQQSAVNPFDLMSEHEPRRRPDENMTVGCVAGHFPTLGGNQILVRQELLVVDMRVDDEYGVAAPRQTVVLAVTRAELSQVTGPCIEQEEMERCRDEQPDRGTLTFGAIAATSQQT